MHIIKLSHVDRIQLPTKMLPFCCFPLGFFGGGSPDKHGKSGLASEMLFPRIPKFTIFWSFFSCVLIFDVFWLLALCFKAGDFVLTVGRGISFFWVPCTADLNEFFLTMTQHPRHLFIARRCWWRTIRPKRPYPCDNYILHFWTFQVPGKFMLDALKISTHLHGIWLLAALKHWLRCSSSEVTWEGNWLQLCLFYLVSLIGQFVGWLQEGINAAMDADDMNDSCIFMNTLILGRKHIQLQQVP